VDTDTRLIVRVATAFYAAIALASVLWAWLFGNLGILLGERAADASGLVDGLVVGVLIVVLSHVMHRLFRFAREGTRVLGELLGPITIAQSFYLAMLSGFAEELCFRGALWPHLGLVGTTMLFAIAHVVPVRSLAGYPIFAAFAGLLLGILREETGSIWPAVVAHMTINGLNLAAVGRLERQRRYEPEPDLPWPPEVTDPATLMPQELGLVEATFPRTVWRYDLRVELTGTDRETLAECLEHEELALFRYMPREDVYEQFRGGMLVFTATFAEPFGAFPRDIATISTYLSETVIGLEAAERFTDETTTDDVRAWKITAQRGEWVKVPLVVQPGPESGKFVVDPDKEDAEVLAAHWNDYPRWFQDGMRFKYPRLRDL